MQECLSYFFSPYCAMHVHNIDRIFKAENILLSKIRVLKVAFIQEGLVRLSFPQTDEPNDFHELEF